MNRNCDILIVGAGLGGLFTGVYLSKKGYRVLLLEKSSQLGGYSTSIVFDGLSFDVGGPQDLTFFGVKGLQTMVDLNLFDNLISMDPHYKVISSDNSYTFSYKNGLEKSLIANFPSEKKAISSFFEFLSDMYEKLDYFFTAEGLTNITPLNVELAKYGNMTAQSYLDEIFSDSLLKQLLLASCVFYQGSPPHELSALYFFGLLSSFITNGAYYYRGGGSKLATDLSNIIISNGGKIITGMEVEKLIIQDGTVCGVSLCNGNTIESPIIIANINLCLPNFIEDPEYKIYLDKFRSRSTALSRCQVYFTVKTEREDLCPVTFLKGTFDDNEEMKSFLQDTPLSLRCFIPSVLSKQNNLHLLSVAVPAAYKSWEAYLQQGKLFYEAKCFLSVRKNDCDSS